MRPVRNASAAAMARVAHFWRGGRLDDSLHLCLNRCRHARNGVCEDRGKCRQAMDCSDCGVRSYRSPPVATRSKKVLDDRLLRRRAVWKRWVSPTSLLDVCLCTLMTADRVPSLHRLASSWTHLMSVAYLADDFEADAAAGFRLLELDGRAVPHKEQLTLSVVEDRGYRKPRSRFPFNLLRNIAVDAAPVDYVCLVDVDFVLYPQRRPGCVGCNAATRLQKWLPLMRLMPHLALVLPAFDGNVAQHLGAKDRMVGVASKRGIARLMRFGHAEGLCVPSRPPSARRALSPLALLPAHVSASHVANTPRRAALYSAHSQYPLGHACDNASRWLTSERPFLAKYTFGCEPYLLYNRRAAPRLWEMFVAYGKDRVSFTYELAARGAPSRQPAREATREIVTCARACRAVQVSYLSCNPRSSWFTTARPRSAYRRMATSPRRG